MPPTAPARTTRLQQELTSEELKLERTLSKIYKSIKRDLNIKLSTGFVQWSEIQRIYRPQINDAVRASVTEMYQISAKKTVERDIKVPYFLTQSDMTEIANLTRKYQDWIMIGLERELVKKTSMAFDPRTLLRVKQDYDLVKNLKETFISRMTQSLHGEVAARAVLVKGRQLINPLKNKTSLLTKFRMAAAIGSGQVESGGPHYVWRTSDDERVCDICSPLDGNEFAIDDPAITTPVVDTHPRCRCELELVDSELSGRNDLYPFNDLQVLYPFLEGDLFEE